MKDIIQIIAENLVALRKKNNLTQQEVAEKLNYSDNTVSRWERAELCPSLETLQQISVIYDIPLELIIRENVLKENTESNKRKQIRGLVTCLLVVSLLLFGATIGYFYCQSFLNLNMWTLFVWFLPGAFIVMFGFAMHYKKRTFSFVMLTLFIWSFLSAFYLQFLEHNLWLIFTLGIPAQLAWTVWTYVMPRKAKKPSREKKEKIEPVVEQNSDKQ